MTATATLPEPRAGELPPPLVKPFRHPVRFVRNQAWSLAYVALFAHIGLFVIAALYYLITQKSQTMNDGWHQLVPNSDLRHAIRDVGEGVLGGLLAQGVVYNHFKRSNRRVGKLTGLLNRRLHVPVVPSALVAAVICGAAAFVAAYYVLNLFHPHAASPDISGSPWRRTYESLWATDLPKKALGVVAAIGARKPMRVIFDKVQLWFVERRIDNDRPVRWYMPPSFRARYNYQLANPDGKFTEHSVTQNILMLGTCVVALGLAAYGYYVLTYIA